jgi:hypothetical protein
MAQVLADVRRYRDALRTSFNAPKQDKDLRWNESHSIAFHLINKYGPVTFARMDDIAYRYA